METIPNRTLLLAILYMFIAYLLAYGIETGESNAKLAQDILDSCSDSSVTGAPIQEPHREPLQEPFPATHLAGAIPKKFQTTPPSSQESAKGGRGHIIEFPLLRIRKISTGNSSLTSLEIAA